MDTRQRVPELEQRIQDARNGLHLGHPCYAYQTVPSTMDLAHQLAQQGAPEGACVWAETQTSGRGRAGRAWTSPAGGIYLSLILRPTRDTREIPQLALVAGLAVAETIHDVTGLWGAIRWPNDVLLNNQKVCGILVEASSSDIRQQTADSSRNQNSYAVVGIGVNVTTAHADLPEGATSLGHWINPVLDRFALAATLFQFLDQNYQQWIRDGFAPIRAQLSRWIGLFGHLVQITTPKDQFQGQAVDLDEAGRLLVRLDSGIIRVVDMGETALLRI